MTDVVEIVETNTVTVEADGTVTIVSVGIAGPQGATGATGATGAAGADGADGVGVPAGGTTGQLLAKSSNTDYDTTWQNAPSSSSITQGGGTVSVGADGSITITPAATKSTTIASGQILLPGGSAAAPSMSWSAATSTGWYRAASGAITFAYAGSDIWSLTSAGANLLSQYLRVPDGSESIPAYSFSNAQNAGMHQSGGVLYFSVAGTDRVRMGGVVVNLNNVPLGWGATISSVDVYLYRDAANTLALRNGTSPQLLRIYNSYASGGADVERGTIGFVGNVFVITPGNAGAGVLRGMVLGASGTQLSFYGVTPVSRQVLATGTGKTVDQVITALQTLGLVSQT